MKKAIIALLLICVAGFAQQKKSTVSEPINLYELELRDGVYYYKNKPYSGEFINVDEYDGDYSTGNMKNGKELGERKFFSSDGNLNAVGNYKDGKLHGEWKSFYYKGNLSVVGNYKDNKQHGEWKHFDKNGKLREVRNYKNGEQQIEKKSFDKNENLVNAQPNTPSIFTDSRDGKKYKYVKIGSQTWMAENLNYATKNGSWCYDNKDANCTKYGRLYDWETAIKSCPSGWHLPSFEEWNELIDFVSGVWKFAGVKLKAKSGWNDYEGMSGNGADNYGFSALPGGHGYGYDNGYDEQYEGSGLNGGWWRRNDNDNYCYYILGIGEYIDASCLGYEGDMSNLHSVRCLQTTAEQRAKLEAEQKARQEAEDRQEAEQKARLEQAQAKIKARQEQIQGQAQATQKYMAVLQKALQEMYEAISKAYQAAIQKMPATQQADIQKAYQELMQKYQEIIQKMPVEQREAIQKQYEYSALQQAAIPRMSTAQREEMQKAQQEATQKYQAAIKKALQETQGTTQ